MRTHLVDRTPVYKLQLETKNHILVDSSGVGYMFVFSHLVMADALYYRRGK